MKKFNEIILHFLFFITVPLLIFYFKWAAQETSSLPGLTVMSDSYFEIISNNLDVIIISLIGSIPIFYMSLFFLTPILFKRSYIKISLYVTILILYFYAVIFITNLVFPMYYFFGTPYAVKVLAPIVLFSALGGTLLAFYGKLQEQY